MSDPSVSSVSSSQGSLFPWVGNKGSHLDIITSNLPPKWDKECKKYIEPFLGSAVVFQSIGPSTAILNDRSEHLMDIYRCMKQNPKRFYQILSKFYSSNSLELHTLCKTEICSTKCIFLRSAMFWYLLRSSLYSFVCARKDGKGFTCCFRESTGGRPLKLKENLYWNLADALRRDTVSILNEDFAVVLDMANKGDFLFLDPPYMNNKRPSRKIYDRFSRDDHVRLVDKVLAASKRGVYIMLFNHDHPYLLGRLCDFRRITIDRLSIKRGNNQFQEYQEVLFLNY